jgi:hypothetical protein
MKVHESEELRAHWRGLEASGIPLEPLEFRSGGESRGSPNGLLIRQEIDVGSQVIMELAGGRAGYILKCFIRQDLPGNTTITDFWLELPWPDSHIEWLPDPAQEESIFAPYTFSCGGWPYPRTDVLNHRLKGVLARGEVRNGLLLGIGWTRPPKTYPHGTKIMATLHIIDQWDRTHSAPFEMYLHRLRKLKKPTYTKSTRGPLLSRRDIITPDKATYRLNQNHEKKEVA